MGLFKKAPDRDAMIKQGIAESEAEAAGGDKKDDDVQTGNEKIDIELTKIKAQLESFGELRKANQERFSRIAEQTGELRGMIIDTNKAMSKIEVAATKAVDMVESVHPEKLMVEVRKQDGKIAAVRALVESNETIMKDLMSELKKMRSQMNFYKGTEQVLKMNEEVKQELADIKKMEAVVERHADRVETIFSEVEKKFTNFEKYDDTVKELQEGFRKLGTDFEKVRAQLVQKEDKKEFADLLDKFNDFEKHTTNLLKLLDDRSKSVKQDLDAKFGGLRKEIMGEVQKVTGEVPKAAKKPEEAESGEQEKPEEKKEAQEESEWLEKKQDEVEKKDASEDESGSEGGSEDSGDGSSGDSAAKKAGGTTPKKSSRFLGRFKKK